MLGNEKSAISILFCHNHITFCRMKSRPNIIFTVKKLMYFQCSHYLKFIQITFVSYSHCNLASEHSQPWLQYCHLISELKFKIFMSFNIHIKFYQREWSFSFNMTSFFTRWIISLSISKSVSMRSKALKCNSFIKDSAWFASVTSFSVNNF